MQRLAWACGPSAGALQDLNNKAVEPDPCIGNEDMKTSCRCAIGEQRRSFVATDWHACFGQVSTIVTKATWSTDFFSSAVNSDSWVPEIQRLAERPRHTGVLTLIKNCGRASTDRFRAPSKLARIGGEKVLRALHQSCAVVYLRRTVTPTAPSKFRNQESRRAALQRAWKTQTSCSLQSLRT